MELEPGAFGRLRFPAIQSDVGECGSAGKLAGEVEVAQVRPRYYGPANSRREIQHAHVQGLRHFSDQSCMDLGSRTTTPGMLHWWPDSASGLPCLGMKKIAKNCLHVVFLALASPLAAIAGFGRFPPTFSLAAQACALVPGVIGDYIRIAFYKLTLKHALYTAGCPSARFSLIPASCWDEEFTLDHTAFWDAARLGSGRKSLRRSEEDTA